MDPKGKIWLGITNGDIPGNKSTFPQEFQDQSRLHYYATLFNTIEINRSFYKLQRAKTYEKWVQDVPNDFQFTLKLSKEITHAKELVFEEEQLDKFMLSSEGIGGKKGCLLIQFPGKIDVEY